MGIWEEVKQRFKQEEKKFPDELETAEEYKLRWRSIHIIYFTMFLMSLGFSIVLTGVWPYLDKLDPTAGKAYMGYVVGANPFAQMIFSPLVGWWSNRLGSIRFPLLATLLVFAMANVVYSSLELFPDGRKYWMLGSRFLVGVSSANVAALRSYLSAATRLSERRKAISMLSLAQVLGFIVGPAIQAAVVPFGNDGFWIIPNHLKLNMYTATGWLNVLLALGNFCLFLPSIFHEHKVAEREAALKQASSSSQKVESQVPKIAAWSLIVFHFVLVFNFMIMETLGSSVAMDQFAFTKAQAISFMGIMMSIGAGLSCICFVIIHPLCQRFGEMNVMIWGGFLLMSIGRFFYIPMSPSSPLTFNEDFRLEVLKNLTLCKDDIKANPVAWNVTEAQLESTKFLNGLCNYEEIVGCPNSQEWCLNTNAILLPQFIIGSIIGTVGFPLGLTLLQTLFSKILGSRPQGVWMGYMTGSGSLSRVLGPVLMTYIYTRFGPNWTFGVTAVMLSCSTIYLWVYSDHFVSPEGSKKEQSKLLESKPIVINGDQESEKIKLAG